MPTCEHVVSYMHPSSAPVVRDRGTNTDWAGDSSLQQAGEKLHSMQRWPTPLSYTANHPGRFVSQLSIGSGVISM